MSLLEIRNLTVEFDTAMGPFRALKGVDYTVETGEVLAIVGESGSGKSVAMLATMGLLPDTATVKADLMTFDGQDLQTLSPQQRRRVIGKDITMIFQEPIASLNPCFTVGFQIGEVLKTHLNLHGRQARNRTIELFEAVGIPDPEKRPQQLPPSDVRWPVPASDDCHGDCLRAEAAHCRRADDGARRDHPETDP